MAEKRGEETRLSDERIVNALRIPREILEPGTAAPVAKEPGPGVSEIPDAKLIERAIRNSRPRSPGQWARWCAVSDQFGLGSTFAIELCRRFDINPHELLEGPVCEACAEAFEEDRDG